MTVIHYSTNIKKLLLSVIIPLELISGTFYRSRTMFIVLVYLEDLMFWSMT